MPKATRVAALLCVALGLDARAESCVWYADDDAIYQVETASNQVRRSLPLKHPYRLAMGAADCGVWAVDRLDRRLLRFDAHGVLELELRVRELDPRLGQIEQLQLDPYDGSLWVADHQRLARISASGELLSSFAAPGRVRRLQLALDQSLWVLGERELWRFDGQAALRESYALPPPLAADASHFAVDSLHSAAWIADAHGLVRLKLGSPAEIVLAARLPHPITGLALDPLTGQLWIALKERLLAYSAAGTPVYSVDLNALGLHKPEPLAFDPASRSLWVGGKGAVSRFTDTGEFVTHFPAKDGDQALATPALRVQPTLTLVRPPLGALTNNPQPELRLAYGADCNGASCGLSSAYFQTYRLSATLNGEEIGGAFQFDPGPGESHYSPPSRLPEGQNVFNAQVKDPFGRDSNAISNTFTVDTIAPRFLSLTPADGSVFQAPQAVIQGSIDDATATVVLERTGLSQTGAGFAFPVTLQAGPNIFTLSAVDGAGNHASAQRTLNYIPLTVNILSPTSGTLVSGSTVQVTGTVQGPPNTGVAVNGIVATVFGDRYYALVPVQTGANTLAVTAKTAEGFTAQQSVSVTSTGPLPVEVSAAPQSGLAPLKASFTVSTVGVSIQRIEVDFDGNGSTDFTTTSPNAPIAFTYTQPGVYAARFAVIDSQGNTHILTQVIVVVSVASMDATLRSTYFGMLARLRAGDIDGALTAFTGSANEKYRTVFTALRPNLASVVDQLGAIQDGTISTEFAEYSLVRNLPDGPHAFLIYFIRGADGVWRIDAM